MPPYRRSGYGKRRRPYGRRSTYGRTISKRSKKIQYKRAKKRRFVRKTYRSKGTFYKYTTARPQFAWAKALFVRDYYPSATAPYDSFTIANNTALQYQWAANSCYDPDYTSGAAGDQGIYWGTQFDDQFSKYCVYGSKITITGKLNKYDGTNLVSNRIYLWPSDDVGAVGGTESSIMLNPGVKYKVLDTHYTQGNGGKFRITSFARTRDVMGRQVTPEPAAMGGLMGGVGTGSSPADLWFWNLKVVNGYPGAAFTPLQSSNAYYLVMRVRITFFVKLSGRWSTVTSDAYGTTVPV